MFLNPFFNMALVSTKSNLLQKKKLKVVDKPRPDINHLFFQKGSFVLAFFLALVPFDHSQGVVVCDYRKIK
jgi:hypothetical protein